jgi:hypothetical protein
MLRWYRCNKPLAPRQTWCVCLLVMGIYVLPLILADYPYMDDLWRAEQAGSAWSAQGRVLTDWLYSGLGFSAGAVNLFPLPLLLATLLAARALADLAKHYFERPTLAGVLVVLPLWLNPFFLQNLSYQYDGAAMALALACSIWAVTQRVGSVRQLLVGAVWVAVAAGFYQLSINVFAGLCCVEVIRAIQGGASLGQSLRLLGWRLAQLLAGALLYRLTAYPLISVPRTDLLAFDRHWLPEMLHRLEVIAGHVQLLATPGTLWVFLPLLGLAALALGRDVHWLACRALPGWHRVGLISVLLLAVVGCGLLVYGLMFLFALFDDGARMLMGFGPFAVMIGVLAHRALVQLPARPTWLLALPCLFLLSFAFAYGRVLVLQKELHQSLAASVAEQFMRVPALASAQAIYVVGSKARSRDQWLPAAEGAFRAMPALRYVLNINYLMQPELLARFGVVHAHDFAFEQWQALGVKDEPVVSSRFFSIYQAHGNAYVLMKVPQAGVDVGW